MNSTWLYRIASVLLILFAAGHQLGFENVDPAWHADSVVAAMKNVRFQVLGMNRSYWEFFAGFGYFVTVLLLFAAIVAWQLSGVAKPMLGSLAMLEWAFAATFVAITLLSWRYFFPVPLAFSAAIALCLLLAAWSARTPSGIR